MIKMMPRATRHYLEVRDRMVIARLRKKELQTESYEDEEDDSSDEDESSSDEADMNKVTPILMGAGMMGRR